MALGAARHPGRGPLHAARSRRGVFRGSDVTVADVYEAIGGYAAGTMSAEELHELEFGRLPRRRRLRRPVHREHDVDDPRVPRAVSPAGLNGIPALSPEEGRRRRASAVGSSSISSAATSGPRRSSRCEAIENAAARSSRPAARRTAVLHLLAIAREFGLAFTIDDFDRDRRPHARSRRHEAVGPLPRDRRLPRGRRRARRPRAREARARPRRDADRRRPHARRGRDRGRGDRGPGGRARRSTGRSRRAARSGSCAATSRRTAAW